MLSIVPGQPQPGDSAFVWFVAATPTVLQKSMHVVVYMALIPLLVWTLHEVESASRRLTFAVAITICLGTLLEVSQVFIPGRYGSLGDIVLNGFGALLGAYLANALVLRRGIF